MPTETVTTRFCAAMLDAARSGLPREAGAAARRTLLNVLGTAISAAGSGAVRTLLAGGGEGDGAGVVLAKGNDQPSRATPYWIALATGTAAHLDDFDDTHLATVIHPGASALATVLAIGREAGGAAFLGAFAAGCEAQLRIGNAISPAHYDHGWHITGTCGVFGAAIAASALFGLDAEAAARAMSLAAVMTVGHREAFGSMTKPLHAGKAAANGMLAAWLAGHGLSGPADPLGAGGVLEVLAGGPGHVDRSALDLASRDGASRGWELEVNTFKTYPCGVVAHPAMDAAAGAFGLIGESPAITGASVTCNPLVLELMGLMHPRDGLQARFSARHGIACGLRYGRAGLAEFSDEVARDPEVTRLRDLIELVPDASCARDAAVLRVSVAGREPVEVAVEHTRGSMDRPLTDAELLAKVEALVSPVLGAGAAAAIRDMVNALPGSPDVDGLLAATGLAESALAGPAPITLNTSESDGSSTPSDPAASPVADAAPTTDVILSLALTEPPLVDRVLVADQADGEAKTSLAVFAEAFAAGKASTVAQAVRAAGDAGMLPEGHAWTAFTSAAAAVSSAAVSSAGAAAAASAGGHALPVETVIACAAATALGEDCAEAVAIGCDVAELVASGLPDAAGQGWSAPVIAALIGATVAAGLMLGLAEHQLRAAIGIAATQAAGLASAEGTDAWPLQAGKAAFNAVEAAQFAQAGFTSSSHPLEGRRGLYALFAS
jgi:2-methylcitrate dehydratase PrpD